MGSTRKAESVIVGRMPPSPSRSPELIEADKSCRRSFGSVPKFASVRFNLPDVIAIDGILVMRYSLSAQLSRSFLTVRDYSAFNTGRAAHPRPNLNTD